jgi:aryl-alcohol dehydrogenase-like predicted oxidoreductase
MFGPKLDLDATRKVIHAAIDAGITHFDTAESYGGGTSESFIGSALGPLRDRVVIATKFQPRPKDEPYTRGVLAKRIRDGCDISLARLRTDRIDLYYQHFPDPEAPIEETLEAFSTLAAAGKVLHFAASNFTSDQLEEASDLAATRTLPSLCGLQIEWNLLNRNAEADVVPTARSSRLGIVPYFPLASGMLTGKYRRGVPFPAGSRLESMDYFKTVLTDANFDRVERLSAFAADRSVSLGDLAIAWLAAQEGVASVITGATDAAQIAANARAAEIELTEADLAAINALVGP